MKTSQSGINLIKEFEGLSLKVYICPAGKRTVGYGHVDESLAIGSKITESAAEELLRRDLVRCEAAIERLVKSDLKQHQFDALVSLIYNIGIGAFSKSTLLKMLNKGDFKGATAQFIRWNKVNGVVNRGLTRRRVAEADMFDGDDDKTMPQAVDAPDKSIAKTRTAKSSIAAAGTGAIAIAAGTAETIAPAVPVVSEVAEVAQHNSTGLIIVLGLILVAFAGYMIWLKMDDHKRH